MISLITNVINFFLQRQATNNANLLSVTFARLSSGMRINSADAAGLQISDRLRHKLMTWLWHNVMLTMVFQLHKRQRAL